MQRCSLFLFMAASASMVHAPMVRAQTITPRFAWPANAVAEVSGVGFTVSTRDGKTDSVSQEITSRLDVRAHPEGLLISIGPSSGDMLPEKLGNIGISRDALGRVVMKFVVSNGGSFVGLDDSLAFLRQMDSVMAPAFARLSALAPAQAANLRTSVLTGRSASATARLSWTGMTGAVFDRSWTVGDSVAEILRQPLPGMPGAEMISAQVTQFSGVVTCPGGSAASVCWRFTKRLSIDMAAMRAEMSKLVSHLGAPDTGILDRLPIPQITSNGYMIYDAATGRPLEVGSTADSQTKGTIGDAPFAMSSHTVMVTHYKWHAM